MLTKSLITRCDQIGDFWEVEIRGSAGILYINKNFSPRAIRDVLSEVYYPWNWHYYQFSGTQVTTEDVVFDCGCAEGWFAFLNRQTAKKIVCFEPLPEYLPGLRKTFEENRRVEIVSAALGPQAGSAYLRRDWRGSSLTSDITDTVVNITTIDSYCSEKQCDVTYIKADLEGYELEVLRGATETIKRLRPKISITTYHKPEHPKEIEDFLKNLVPSYKIATKGVASLHGGPMLLHAWHS
jgi:FkbM family methyltransferase